MPAYSWYFEAKEHAEATDVVVPVPTTFAPSGKVIVALVQYLLSLRQVSSTP